VKTDPRRDVVHYGDKVFFAYPRRDIGAYLALPMAVVTVRELLRSIHGR
jgi:hypothetical protein